MTSVEIFASQLSRGMMPLADGVSHAAAVAMQFAMEASHPVMGAMREPVAVMAGAAAVSHAGMGSFSAEMIVMYDETAVSPHPAGMMELPDTEARDRTGVVRVAGGGARVLVGLVQRPAVVRPQAGGAVAASLVAVSSVS